MSQPPVYPASSYPANGAPNGYVPSVPLSGVAVLGLVFAVLGVWPVVGAPFAIPAVVCGHMARRETGTGGKRGAGVALAALVIGYAGIAGTVAAVIWMFISVARQV